MRLLILIKSLGSGGAERNTVELLSSLSALGWETKLLHLIPKQVGYYHIDDADCRVKLLEPPGWHSWIPQTRAVLRSFRPHLVNSVLFEADMVARLAAAGTGIPVLTSLVSGIGHEEASDIPAPPGLRFWLAELADRITARHLTCHFHAISEAVKKTAIRRMGLPPSRVSVVRAGRDPAGLGVRTRERRIAVREKLGLTDEDQIILNVGRRDLPKGQEYLIRALGQLRADRPRLKLLIAGRPGSEASRLDDLVRDLELESSVRMLGFRDDVPDLLAAADLFAFSSLYEGLPGAVIEAMALGLPIVASDLEAIRELVEEGGNADLVPRRSSTALAEAIGALLDDAPRARRYGRRSREIFERDFTLARFAEGMIELYESIARQGGNGRSLGGFHSYGRAAM